MPANKTRRRSRKMNKPNFSLETSNDGDDDFFVVLERSRTNLDKVFGIEKSPETENDQLKTTQSAQRTWSTVIVKVATAYKSNQSVGKVGVALLQSPENGSKLIVYKTKSEVLATLTLNILVDTPQLRKQSTYLQFYDNNVIYWSLCFQNESEEQEFMKKLQECGIKVEKAKANELDVQCIINENIQTPTSTEEREELNVKTTHSKTKLISRMAKMGQQLPRFPAAPCTPIKGSDSSDTEVITTSMKPAIVPRNIKSHMKTQLVSTTSMGNMSIYKNSGPAAVSPIETQFMHMLVSENRTQNTEMRINMSKMDSKMDIMMDKIEMLKVSGRQSPNREDEMLELEEKLLELKKENRKLKQTLSSIDRRLTGDTGEQLLQSYQSEMESKLCACQNNLDISEATLMETTKSLKAVEQRLRDAKKENENALAKVDELESSVKSLQEALILKQTENSALQMKLTEQLSIQASAPIVKQDAKTTTATVKAIMNNLHGQLTETIENLDTLDKANIIALIGKTIKAETLEAIQK